MPDLIPQSPLFDVVQYNEREFFTSQYFHRLYLLNSAHGGKYRRHPDFMRVVRAMPTYHDYVTLGDIVELQWNGDNTEVKQFPLYFKPLFQAAGFRPLTLLNATAQAALTHHLDDELSKQLSVAANTATARQLTRKSGAGLLPEEIAARQFDALSHIARRLGTPEYLAQQEVVKMIEASTGVNLHPLLAGAPAQDMIDPDEEMLEPTELAKLLRFPSAYALNKALATLGWQRRLAIGWEPIGDGIRYSARHAWVSGGKPGLNWKWQIMAVRQALRPQDTEGNSFTKDPGVPYRRQQRMP